MCMYVYVCVYTCGHALARPPNAKGFRQAPELRHLPTADEAAPTDRASAYELVQKAEATNLPTEVLLPGV